jgi:hypothetical protein
MAEELSIDALDNVGEGEYSPEVLGDETMDVEPSDAAVEERDPGRKRGAQSAVAADYSEYSMRLLALLHHACAIDFVASGVQPSDEYELDVDSSEYYFNVYRCPAPCHEDPIPEQCRIIVAADQLTPRLVEEQHVAKARVHTLLAKRGAPPIAPDITDVSALAAAHVRLTNVIKGLARVQVLNFIRSQTLTGSAACHRSLVDLGLLHYLNLCLDTGDLARLPSAALIEATLCFLEWIKPSAIHMDPLRDAGLGRIMHRMSLHPWVPAPSRRRFGDLVRAWAEKLRTFSSEGPTVMGQALAVDDLKLFEQSDDDFGPSMAGAKRMGAPLSAEREAKRQMRERLGLTGALELPSSTESMLTSSDQDRARVKAARLAQQKRAARKHQ